MKFLKDIGHHKRGAWEKTINGVALRHGAMGASELAQGPHFTALQQATDNYVVAKRFRSPAEQDARLLSLIDRQAPGTHAAVGALACTGHLSGNAVTTLVDRQVEYIIAQLRSDGEAGRADLHHASRVDLLRAVVVERAEVMRPDDARVLQSVHRTLWTCPEKPEAWGAAIVDLWHHLVSDDQGAADVSATLSALCVALTKTWLTRALRDVIGCLATGDLASAQDAIATLHALPDEALRPDWLLWRTWRAWDGDRDVLEAIPRTLAACRNKRLSASLCGLLGPATNPKFATAYDQVVANGQDDSTATWSDLTLPKAALPRLRAYLYDALPRAAAGDASVWHLGEALFADRTVDGARLDILATANTHLNRDNRQLLVDVVAQHAPDAPAIAQVYGALANAVHDTQQEALPHLVYALGATVQPALDALQPSGEWLHTEAWQRPDGWRSLAELASVVQGASLLAPGPHAEWLQRLSTWRPPLAHLEAMQRVRMALQHRAEGLPEPPWLCTLTKQLGPTGEAPLPPSLTSLLDALVAAGPPLADALCDVPTVDLAWVLITQVLPHLSANASALIDLDGDDPLSHLSAVAQCLDTIPWSALQTYKHVLTQWWTHHTAHWRRQATARINALIQTGDHLELARHRVAIAVLEAHGVGLPIHDAAAVAAWRPNLSRLHALRALTDAFPSGATSLLKALMRLEGPATAFSVGDTSIAAPAAPYATLRAFVEASKDVAATTDAVHVGLGDARVELTADPATLAVTRFIRLTNALLAVLTGDALDASWAAWLRHGVEPLLGAASPIQGHPTLLLALLDGRPLDEAAIADALDILQGMNADHVTTLRALLERRATTGHASIHWDLHALLADCTRNGAPALGALQRVAAGLGYFYPSNTPVHLTCPLGGILFVRPVIAEDGFTYESAALRMAPAGVSPMTGKPMGRAVVADALMGRLAEAWNGGTYPSLADLLAHEAVCCVTGDPLEDPVVLADGETYERVFATAWLKHSSVSPRTNKPLAHKAVHSHQTWVAMQQSIRRADNASAASGAMHEQEWVAHADAKLRADYLALLVAARALKQRCATLADGVLRDDIDRLGTLPVARAFALYASVPGVAVVSETSLRMHMPLPEMTELQRIALGLPGVQDMLVRIDFNPGGEPPTCVLSWAGQAQGVSTPDRILVKKAPTSAPWMPNRGVEALAGFQLTRYLRREVTRLCSLPDAEVQFVDTLHRGLTAKLDSLASSCIGCDKALEGRLLRPSTCEDRGCVDILNAADINVRLHEIRHDPRTADLFISMVYATAQANQLDFLKECPVRDVQAVRRIISHLPPITDLQKDPSLQTTLKNIDPKAEALLGWILRSQRGFFVRVPEAQQIVTANTPHQFAFVHGSAAREAEFAARAGTNITRGFHGSSLVRWYSILRIGLQNYSGTRYMAHGAYGGPGIYVAQNMNTSLSYAKGAQGRNWRNSMFPRGFYCIAVCEVANHVPSSVMVVPDARDVMVRYLLVYENGARPGHVDPDHIVTPLKALR